MEIKFYAKLQNWPIHPSLWFNVTVPISGFGSLGNDVCKLMQVESSVCHAYFAKWPFSLQIQIKFTWKMHFLCDQNSWNVMLVLDRGDQKKFAPKSLTPFGLLNQKLCTFEIQLFWTMIWS